MGARWVVQHSAVTFDTLWFSSKSCVTYTFHQFRWTARLLAWLASRTETHSAGFGVYRTKTTKAHVIGMVREKNCIERTGWWIDRALRTQGNQLTCPTP